LNQSRAFKLIIEWMKPATNTQGLPSRRVGKIPADQVIHMHLQGEYNDVIATGEI
jgi:hypothetical protein